MTRQGHRRPQRAAAAMLLAAAGACVALISSAPGAERTRDPEAFRDYLEQHIDWVTVNGRPDASERDLERERADRAGALLDGDDACAWLRSQQDSPPGAETSDPGNAGRPPSCRSGTVLGGGE